MTRNEILEVVNNFYKSGASEREVAFAREILKASKKDWIGLTEEEMQSLADKYKEPLLFRFAEFAHAIEAKLKEKNHG